MGLSHPARLGMFGGAFDPPHNAHVALAQAAVEQMQLDELRIVPTGQAWHKTRQLTLGAQRLEMVRLAFASVPGAVVDDRELRRNGPSYTIDTLLELRAEHPGTELVLVIGEDQAAALPSWRRWREIPSFAIISIADRTVSVGAEGQIPSEIGPIDRFFRLQLPLMPESATDVRARLLAGERVDHLVPKAVARYIDQHHLYRIA